MRRGCAQGCAGRYTAAAERRIALSPDEIRKLLSERGALLSGHFLLTSGMHSDVYIQKFRVFEWPVVTAELGRAVAQAAPAEFDVVASPAMGAVVLGFTAALAADTRSVFAERVDGALRFRRGFDLEPGERTLIVEDVVTTGGSTREVIDLVRAAGGDPVGVVALVDRSATGDPALGVPFRALTRVEVETWDPDECPLCAQDLPLVSPKD